MAVSKSRVREVLSYANEYGEDRAMEVFEVKKNTLGRYRRLANEWGMVGLHTYAIPKVLLFDIETSPREFYAWRAGKQYLKHDNMIKDSAILTYSAKWLCDDEIMTEKVSVEEAKNREDAEITQKLWNLFDEADILIAHNLKGFDEPYANTRFMTNDLLPPSPYRRIDTYRDFRSQSRELSNKLDYLTKKYGMSEKQDVKFDLWIRCVNGEEAAIDEMLAYNKQDVRALEDLYLKIRPWIKSHPNMALYYHDVNDRCSNCGSKELEVRGEYYTNANVYDALRCSNCGAYGRRRHTKLHEKKKERMSKPTAR